MHGIYGMDRTGTECADELLKSGELQDSESSMEKNSDDKGNDKQILKIENCKINVKIDQSTILPQGCSTEQTTHEIYEFDDAIIQHLQHRYQSPTQSKFISSKLLRNF